MFTPAVILLLAAPASASGVLPFAPASFSIQPEAVEAVAAATPAPSAAAYGVEGSTWLTVGVGWAPDFDDENDVNLHAAWSKFLVQDIEFGLEGAAWYFDQEVDDELGGSLAMFFKWHFVNTGDWSVFADVGIGLLGSGGNVPDGGSSFNFLPRAGVGLTRRLGDGGTRVQLGVSWHHISNARIFGDRDNPARDRVMFHSGLVFPLR
jgi:hypothetical protein